MSEQHLSALEVDDLEATDSPEAEQQTAAEAPQAPHDEAIDAEASGSPRRGMPRRALLEREGEVAADFLETLLDIADLDGDIDLDIDGDRAAVAIVDSDEGRVPRRLVGNAPDACSTWPDTAPSAGRRSLSRPGWQSRSAARAAAQSI